MNDELKKIAWKNLNENSKEIDGKTIVEPKNIGDFYPLAYLHGGEDFVGVFIGKHQLFKEDKKKRNLFTTKTALGEYMIYSSEDSIMLWTSEDDCEGPFRPAGISVDKKCLADKKNKKTLEKKFGKIFEDLEKGEKK